MKKAFTLFLGLGLAAAAHAQLSLQQLVAFSCTSTSCPVGEQPDGLILSSDGNFYGVAGASIPGGGTIFKMTPSGQITQIYRFPHNNTTGFFPNGYNPDSIAEGSDGLLYGTASSGGPTSASLGTLWRVHKDGTGFQVLQQYCTSCTNGGAPNNIIAASDGNLYGTTGYGGFFPSSGICESLGCGVVFKLTTAGVYTVLHRFNGTTDTALPNGVTQASDGNFYGGTDTLSGGALYRITSSGQFTVLYTFPTSTYTLAPLTQASNGLLYGYSHVVSAPNVELFSLSTGGVENNIASITQALFKQYGLGQILQASDGNFWTSASVASGGSGYGRVFSVTTSGTVVDSLSFNGKQGGFPTGGLIQAANGTLYGTTIKDGTNSSGGFAQGVIYTVTGLPPK